MNAAGTYPLEFHFRVHHQNNPFNKLNFSLWYPEEKRKKEGGREGGKEKERRREGD